MKLISITEFVLNEQKNIMWDSFNKVVRYANFLKEPLTLGMFIPCWYRNGVHIPIKPEDLINSTELFNEFEQAKERVLFEGFEIRESYEEKALYSIKNNVFVGSFIDGNFKFFFFYKTIEDLIEYNLTLTDLAIKQLGL